MYQPDTRAIAQFIMECMDPHGHFGSQSQASDPPLGGFKLM